MPSRYPEVDELVAEPALAALAVLDTALCVAARALRAACPESDWDFQPGEEASLTAARIVIDECDSLLYCIDSYRTRVMAQLRDQRRRGDDWPF